MLNWLKNKLFGDHTQTNLLILKQKLNTTLKKQIFRVHFLNFGIILCQIPSKMGHFGTIPNQFYSFRNEFWTQLEKTNFQNPFQSKLTQIMPNPFKIGSFRDHTQSILLISEPISIKIDINYAKFVQKWVILGPYSIDSPHLETNNELNLKKRKKRKISEPFSINIEHETHSGSIQAILTDWFNLHNKVSKVKTELGWRNHRLSIGPEML